MAEQNFGVRGIQTGQCLVQVAVLRKGGKSPVFYAYQVQPLAIPLQGHGFIEQEAPSQLAVGGLEGIEIRFFGLVGGPLPVVAVVVVAQDGIDTAWGFLGNGLEGRNPRFHLVGRVVDQVSGENHGIGTGIQKLVDSRLDFVGVREGTAVYVGNLGNSVAFKGFRKAG